MKYEELQYERIGDANKTSPASTLVIRKQFVDAAIAELKAEINRKEAVGQRWFVRCMEARAENVRLKRALWLARKEVKNPWNNKD